ncbi:MAG: AraC family transcriptional regulator [Halieaceae bacterium]|nr:AraC family transcriptional regulator [Halieaceae bacterium]
MDERSRPRGKTRRLMRRRVLHVLLLSNLDQVNATRVAQVLCVSPSTLRRRLRAEGASYQQLLDQVRRYRCEKTLARRWLPGKGQAGELGFSQPNSFYRAFGRWTGMTYTQYKRRQRRCSAGAAQPLY